MCELLSFKFEIIWTIHFEVIDIFAHYIVKIMRRKEKFNLNFIKFRDFNVPKKNFFFHHETLQEYIQAYKLNGLKVSGVRTGGT